MTEEKKISSQLATVAYLSLFLMVILIGSFIAWRKVWFNPYGGKSLS